MRRSRPTTGRNLAKVSVPTLVIQSAQDVIAPPAMGKYVHRHIAGSAILTVDATGHCPHMSARAATADRRSAPRRPRGPGNPGVRHRRRVRGTGLLHRRGRPARVRADRPQHPELVRPTTRRHQPALSPRRRARTVHRGRRGHRHPVLSHPRRARPVAGQPSGGLRRHGALPPLRTPRAVRRHRARLHPDQPPTHTDGEALRRHLRRPPAGTVGDADLSNA
ncbi:alpha/beta fold hydrolase [Pseudonocardia sulfidoxydans]|uniref:alpha/beta fold hydrolase n=1 Tax=Pseudonocardia sulfidoxydans TaxID=54011 RepID=UPI0035F0BACC